MKRNKFIVVLSLILALTCMVPASAATAAAAKPADAAATEVTPKMNTKTINGNDLAWVPGGVYVKPGADRVLLDYCAYMLKTPLETKNDVVFISLDDLTTIYAPDFTVKNSGGKITITHAGVTATIQVGKTDAEFYTGKGKLEAAPYERKGVIFVPYFDLMSKGFGKTIVNSQGFYGVGNTADFAFPGKTTSYLKLYFRGKDMGRSYWAYWNEDTHTLEPVVVYIPTTYNAKTPNKMVVQLHGAGGNAMTYPDGNNGQQIMQCAEKYGYIVMWVNSYAKQCNFGMWVQPAGQLPITDKTDPKNPGGYSEAKLADIKLSGENVQKAMDFVESKWNIDKKNVFVMGQSMGGCGTWFQATAYGDRFKAASPSGAFVEPAYFDWSTVKIPVRYVGGTEDHNGFDLMLNAYDIAMKQGANIVEFIPVAGAGHGSEWPAVLEETYQFFESYVTK